MKLTKTITAAVLVTAFLASPLTILAADGPGDKAKAEKPAKVKPYTLDTCPVSGEKLGSDANMKPYTFTHAGREIKLCCKGCLKDFNKEPGKYISQIEKAEKEAAKGKKNNKS